VAEHNAGSIRVLEKCGFRAVREESVKDVGKGVVELVLVLQ
jgi:RimJ/RimL family protein N-acetyltransferase